MIGFALAEIVAVPVCISVAVIAFARLNRRPPRSLAAAACPECGHIYGEHILVSVVPVAYRWMLAPGHSRASLQLPRTTHLVTCPQCLAEFEFKEDGTLFEHPQQGILSCVRQGRARRFHAPTRRVKLAAA